MHTRLQKRDWVSIALTDVIALGVVLIFLLTPTPKFHPFYVVLSIPFVVTAVISSLKLAGKL